MKKKIETGKRYGKWVVICDSGIRKENGTAIWKCLCECGNIGFIRGDNLRRGTSTQCNECRIEERKRGRYK